MWGSIFGFLGNAVSGFFGAKKEQGKILRTGLEVINDVNSSAAAKEAAIAQVISAEASSGNKLAAIWRPLTMIVFLGIIVSYWFGYVPPQLNGPMPPMIAELFALIKLGLMGYIPARTVEKVIEKVQLGKILNTFISRKI